MSAPAFRLHNIYSIRFTDKVDVLIYDLNMVDRAALAAFLETKTATMLTIVPHQLAVNFQTKRIAITGCQLDDHTFILSKADCGSHNYVQYSCDNSQIITALQYLNHMLQNLQSPV